MTGIHFLGCKCCGTYDRDRHNQVAQVALNNAFASASFKNEMGCTGSTASGSFDVQLTGRLQLEVCGHFGGCQWQEQAHRRTGLGEPHLSEKSGLSKLT